MDTQLDGIFLPEGVIGNILSRLPVESLIRLKTVGESWRELLSCPYFVQMQLDFAQKNQKLLLYSQSIVTYIPDIAIIDKTIHNLPVCKNRIFTPFQFNFDDDDGVIEDSCNGLLSFRFNDQPTCIYLWNPATRESRRVKLPYTDIFDQPCVGIAFVAKINDYKMVRIPSNASMWVYSLKYDIWKELNLYCRCGPLVSGQAVSVHGCMHWIKEEEDGRDHIIAFDVENELLRYLELPNGDELKNFIDRELGVIKGLLSLVMSFCSKKNGLAYEIWQMSEYMVRNSWKKVFFVASSDEMGVPLGFYNDRIFFRYSRNNYEDVFSYDPFTGVKMYFHLPACLNPQVVNYAETFASLAM